MAYATPDDLVAFTGQDPTADDDRQLQRASDDIDANLIGAWYAHDSSGNPTDAGQITALKNAVCAQVEYWRATGDEFGQAEAYESVQIGSVILNRGKSSAKWRKPPLAPRTISFLRLGGFWPTTPVAW